jgi:hypothetical protein
VAAVYRITFSFLLYRKKKGQSYREMGIILLGPPGQWLRQLLCLMHMNSLADDDAGPDDREDREQGKYYGHLKGKKIARVIVIAKSAEGDW